MLHSRGPCSIVAPLCLEQSTLHVFSTYVHVTACPCPFIATIQVMELSCHISLIPVVSELSGYVQASNFFCLLHRLLALEMSSQSPCPLKGSVRPFSIMLFPGSFPSSLFPHFSGIFLASIPTEPSLKSFSLGQQSCW